jgi:predicted ester cyclase
MGFFKTKPWKKDKAAAAAVKAAVSPTTRVAKPAQGSAPKFEETVKIEGEEKHATTTTADGQGKAQTELYNKSPPAVTKTKTKNNSTGVKTIPVTPPRHVHIPVDHQPEQSKAALKNPSPLQPKNQLPPTSNIMKTPPCSIPDSTTTTTNSSNTNSNTNGHLDAPDASIEVTRDLVKRFISDIWNRGEIEWIPRVCHPSLRFNGHVGMDRVGHEGFARMVTTVRDALTDYHCEIHSMVVESNKAFCRLRFTGKHTGNLLGYPPTGKTVAWMGASEFTCKNGKILKVWELGDVKSLEEQLKESDEQE